MAVLAFTAIIASTAAAQKPQRVTIGDDVACPQCGVVYQRIARIGDVDGPGALGGINYGVAVDGRGRYWVGGKPPHIFAADGRFLQQAAKVGPGPLEIPQYMRPIALPGDSVLLADARGNAMVFTPDLRIARRIRTPQYIASAIGTVVRWPDLITFSGMLAIRQETGWPLHAMSLASSEARVAKSFGHTKRRLHAGSGLDVFVRNGEVWTIDREQYRITRWNSSFEPVQVYERRARWWRKPTANALGDHNTPPSPLAEAAVFDREGHLWVFLSVGRNTWKAAWSRVPRGAGEIPAGLLDDDKLFQTRIEVIDLQRRQVLARSDIPRRIVSVLPDGRAAFIVETPEGLRQVEIVALSLQRR